MNARSRTKAKAISMPTPSFTPTRPGLLQRCSGFDSTPGLADELTTPRRKRLASQPPLIQPKLTINQPNDQYEQEADWVAEQVMRMPEPCSQCKVEPEEEAETLQAKPLAPQITPLVQRQIEPEEEEEEEPIQAKQSGGQTPQVVEPGLETQIHSLRGGGQPLPRSVRSFFEPRFGHDFSRVRVHADARAAESARAVSAQAYTVGPHVVFGAGQYAPALESGRQILAHELTHVVQQGGSSLELQGAPRAIQRRVKFDANCSADVRSKILGGHRLAEWATKRASEILRKPLTGDPKAFFDFLFGTKGERNRRQVATNFAVLHNALKKNYKIQCPAPNEYPCKYGDKATGGEMLDKDNVVICWDTAGEFTDLGMARLLVHESVRREHGATKWADDLATAETDGECRIRDPKIGKPYVQATTDKNHPVPYSCFAEALISFSREEMKKKKEVDTLFKSLCGKWDGSSWSGNMTIKDAKTRVSVNVALFVRPGSGLDYYFVMGNYWYHHPKHGEVKGDLEGDINFIIGPVTGEHEALYITFDWREKDARGRGFWLSKGKDKLDGHWGRGDSMENGGRWTIRKKP